MKRVVAILAICAAVVLISVLAQAGSMGGQIFK